ERGPAGVDLQWVVAEQAERGDIAGRRQRLGDVVRAADSTGPGQRVHVRRVRRPQGRSSAERLLRLIGTASGNDDRVIHASSRLRPPPSSNLRSSFSVFLLLILRAKPFPRAAHQSKSSTPVSFFSACACCSKSLISSRVLETKVSALRGF